MIGEVANAAAQCRHQYNPNEKVYLRIHTYYQGNNSSEWTRMGSDMVYVTAEELYTAAGNLIKRILSGTAGMITHGKLAFKVVIANGKGNICMRDVGASYLPEP